MKINKNVGIVGIEPTLSAYETDAEPLCNTPKYAGVE